MAVGHYLAKIVLDLTDCIHHRMVQHKNELPGVNPQRLGRRVCKDRRVVDQHYSGLHRQLGIDPLGRTCIDERAELWMHGKRIS
jgi:hypothetical protein